MEEIEKFLNDNFAQQVTVVKRPIDFFHMRVNLFIKNLEISISNNSTKYQNVKGLIKEGIRTNFEDINFNFYLREQGYKINFTLDDFKINLFEEVLDENNQIQQQKKIEFLKKFSASSVSKIENNPNKGYYLDMQVEGNPL